MCDHATRKKSYVSQCTEKACNGEQSRPAGQRGDVSIEHEFHARSAYVAICMQLLAYNMHYKVHMPTGRIVTCNGHFIVDSEYAGFSQKPIVALVSGPTVEFNRLYICQIL